MQTKGSGSAREILRDILIAPSYPSPRGSIIIMTPLIVGTPFNYIPYTVGSFQYDKSRSQVSAYEQY